MDEILEYIQSGKSYCTDHYEISWVVEIGEVYFGDKHNGYCLSVEKFRKIDDIDDFIIKG